MFIFPVCSAPLARQGDANPPLNELTDILACSDGASSPSRNPTAAKIAISHDPAIIYKPGDGVVSSGLAYVAVRACQAVVC